VNHGVKNAAGAELFGCFLNCGLADDVGLLFLAQAKVWSADRAGHGLSVEAATGGLWYSVLQYSSSSQLFMVVLQRSWGRLRITE
jgi:hypothetical protein